MKRIIIALATAAMVFGFVGATMAADWNFYGSTRLDTFWTSGAKELSPVTNSSKDTLQWAMAANSRFGATVKDNDNLSGGVQFGVEGPDGANTVYTRLLYGVYNFGGVQLEIGQDYVPVNIFYSNQVFGSDTDMLDMGMPYGGRHPMIQITTNGFQLALIDPSTDASDYGYALTKVEIPKIEAKYTFTVQNVTLQAYGGYQTFKGVNDAVGTAKVEQDINAWIAGLGVQSSFGAFYANANGYVAQNPADYGLWYDNGFTRDGAAVAAGTVINNGSKSDTNVWGGGVVLGYNINETVKVEAGYSYTSASNNNSGATGAEAGKLKGESQEYYIQAPISIAKGVSLTPEAGVFDYMNSKQGGATTKNGTDSYIGAKWQIDF